MTYVREIEKFRKYVVVDRYEPATKTEINPREKTVSGKEEAFALFDEFSVPNGWSFYTAVVEGYYKSEKGIVRLGVGSETHAVTIYYRETAEGRRIVSANPNCGSRRKFREHSARFEAPTGKNVTCKKCLARMGLLVQEA
jgi:hypothetical protein